MKYSKLWPYWSIEKLPQLLGRFTVQWLSISMELPTKCFFSRWLHGLWSTATDCLQNKLYIDSPDITRLSVIRGVANRVRVSTEKSGCSGWNIFSSLLVCTTAMALDPEEYIFRSTYRYTQKYTPEWPVFARQYFQVSDLCILLVHPFLGYCVKYCALCNRKDMDYA